MNVTHIIIHIYLYINRCSSTINLYQINVIFYSTKLLDEVYKINGLNHQNKLNIRPKMLELHLQSKNCTIEKLCHYIKMTNKDIHH